MHTKDFMSAEIEAKVRRTAAQQRVLIPLIDCICQVGHTVTKSAEDLEKFVSDTFLANIGKFMGLDVVTEQLAVPRTPPAQIVFFCKLYCTFVGMLQLARPEAARILVNTGIWSQCTKQPEILFNKTVSELMSLDSFIQQAQASADMSKWIYTGLLLAWGLLHLHDSFYALTTAPIAGPPAPIFEPLLTGQAKALRNRLFMQAPPAPHEVLLPVPVGARPEGESDWK